MTGLFKVIFSLPSTSNNIMRLYSWVIHLIFVRRFGPTTEPTELNEYLAPYRKCLNKLSGIYIIRIGKVKDLRKSMNICPNKYHWSIFDSAYVFKFGRSENIIKRFKQHQKQHTGYGKYSDSVSLEWFVVIPPKLCVNAESELNKYFEHGQYKFEFNDGSRDHTELVIINEGVEWNHMKKKCVELMKRFPRETSIIIEQMATLKLEHDRTIDRMILQHEHELLKVYNEKKDLQHEINLLKSGHEKDLNHEINLLKSGHEKDLQYEASLAKANHDAALANHEASLAGANHDAALALANHEASLAKAKYESDLALSNLQNQLTICQLKLELASK